MWFSHRTQPEQRRSSDSEARSFLWAGRRDADGHGTSSFSTTGLITFAAGQAFAGSVDLGTSGVIFSDGVQLIGSGRNGNAVFGLGAMPNQGGSGGDVAIGDNALSAAAQVTDTIAIGRSALLQATSTSGNVAIGDEAMFMDTTGSGNVALGEFALQSTKTGNFNVAVGSGTGSLKQQWELQHLHWCRRRRQHEFSIILDCDRSAGWKSGRAMQSCWEV